jgi:hypothetical protein
MEFTDKLIDLFKVRGCKVEFAQNIFSDEDSIENLKVFEPGTKGVFFITVAYEEIDPDTVEE